MRFIHLSILITSVAACSGCVDPIAFGSTGRATPRAVVERLPVAAEPEPAATATPLSDPVPSTGFSLKIDNVTGETDEYIRIIPKTNGTAVQYYAIDRGLRIIPSDFSPDGLQTLVSASKKGRYRVLAYSSYDNKPTPPIVFVVEVVDPDSPDVPQPTPTPTPAPPTPVPTPSPVPLAEGRLGLVVFTYNTVMAGIPANKRSVCATLSANYTLVATQIAAGTIKTPEEANAKLKAGNHAAIADADVALWTPVFQKLNEKANSLKLKQLADFQEAYVEFAAAFAAAGK